LALEERKNLKCLIWDLDNTLWRGTLLEGDAQAVAPEVAHVVRTLDGRGILQSIASRNEPDHALARVREQGLGEYFLHPQIGWGPKSGSVQRIAQRLNLGLDAMAFIDDDPYERAEVQASHPQVTCFDPRELSFLLDLPELTPRFLTGDAARRRRMYLEDEARSEAEASFGGPKEEFLAGLGMTFTIQPAREEDLQRAEELTLRTNQLNATGYTYSYDELDALRASPRHRLLIASLTDRFGDYGKIGLGLVEVGAEAWTLKLMLMSCRVMSRGVGTLLLHHVMGLAKAAGARLRAEFVPTDRNRMMYVTYKFAGFEERCSGGGVQLLESTLAAVPPPPRHVRLVVGD